MLLLGVRQLHDKCEMRELIIRTFAFAVQVILFCMDNAIVTETIKMDNQTSLAFTVQPVSLSRGGSSARSVSFVLPIRFHSTVYIVSHRHHHPSSTWLTTTRICVSSYSISYSQHTTVQSGSNDHKRPPKPTIQSGDRNVWSPNKTPVKECTIIYEENTHKGTSNVSAQSLLQSAQGGEPVVCRIAVRTLSCRPENGR